MGDPPGQASPPGASAGTEIEPDEGAEPFELASEDGAERRHAGVDESLHGERLDKMLVSMAGEFSRSHLQTLIDAGHVQVDGLVQRSASRRVRAGQRVDVTLMPTAQSQAFRPEPMALTIVHEDRDVMVIDKPAGLVVHPAAGHWSATLLNGLLAHHAGAVMLPRAGIVHRLDKDTSGLMVVGKTLEAVTALVRAIAARDVGRRYLALCHGFVEPPRTTIDAPIARDPQSRVRMAIVAGGKPARTDVERVGSIGRVSAVRCSLHTGRTHQIRVHLASRGHPLVADALYGGAPALGMARQALHAHELVFAHPRTGETLRFVAPAPPDLAAAWAQVNPDV